MPGQCLRFCSSLSPCPWPPCPAGGRPPQLSAFILSSPPARAIAGLGARSWWRAATGGTPCWSPGWARLAVSQHASDADRPSPGAWRSVLGVGPRSPQPPAGSHTAHEGCPTLQTEASVYFPFYLEILVYPFHGSMKVLISFTMVLDIQNGADQIKWERLFPRQSRNPE